MSDKKTSVAKERQVNCYPSPVLLQKLDSYSKSTGETKSSIVCEALNSYLKDKNIPITKSKE